MIEAWVVFTLIHTFIGAAYTMTNDVFQQDGDVAVFWRSVFATAGLMVVMPFVDWPDDAAFYWLVAVTGLFYAVGDVIMFQVFKDHGGAVISRVRGIKPLLLFLLWPFLHDDSMEQLARAPVIAGGIGLCILGGTVALGFSQRNPLTRAAFLAILPSLILFSIADITNTFSVPAGTDWNRVLVLCFLISTIMVIVSGSFMRIQKGRIVVPERVILTGGINGALFVGLHFTMAFAFSLAANPAHVNALSGISAVWAWLIHRFVLKKDDHASPIAGFAIVFFAALLAFFVGMLPK